MTGADGSRSGAASVSTRLARRLSGWQPVAMYGLAVVAATAFTRLLQPLLGPALSPLFFAAVVLSARYGGLGPGLWRPRWPRARPPRQPTLRAGTVGGRQPEPPRPAP